MAKAAVRRGGNGGFLPSGAPAVLRRLGWQAAGILLLTLGLLLMAALATHNPHDPSLNTSSVGTATNFLGWGGAVLSDLLLQWLGIVAWVPGLALIVWGGRMCVAAAPPEHPGLRSLMLLCALLLMAAFLAVFSLPANHVPPSVLGGAVMLGGSAGRLIHTGFEEAASLVHAAPYGWILGVLAGILGIICAAYAFGVTRADWDALTRVGKWIGNRPQMLRERREPALDDDEDDAQDRSRGEPSFERKSPVERNAGRSIPIDADMPAEREEPTIAPRAPRAPPAPKKERENRDSRQRKLDLPGDEAADSEFELPPLDLLAAPPPSKGPELNEDALKQNARMLESVLDDFGVNGQVTTVRPGPVVTLYELEPAPGTKTSRVIGLSDDIARQMSALSVRIATVPGRSVIGIELPNAKRETVLLRELLDTETFRRTQAPLTLVLGKDIGGQPMMVDLARMPHLLIAGTTGSGKSVAINTMILSLLYHLPPKQCRMIMIDPKMLELSVYDGIPHLLTPVVTEPGKAVVALKWAVREMEDRYRKMSWLGVRNIAGYNQRLSEARAKGEKLTRTVQTGFDRETDKPIYEEQDLPLEPLPFIVVVVDEMADLMMVAGKEIEAAVQRLAQMARAAGIHLIMATQRPSVDVITGTIKANFPSRISFQVTSKIDSRTILGEQGAEQLLGQGDMLYMAAGGRIIRVHGPFVSDGEVETVVEHLRAQGEPTYIEEVTAEEEVPEGPGGGNAPVDELYDQAVAVVAREGKASTSFIQRHLQIGYNRAARIIEQMEREGIVGRANAMGKREIMVRRTNDDE